MFGLFEKRGEGEVPAADVRLRLIESDEADLIIEGDGRRYRLAWGDVARLVDGRGKAQEKKETAFAFNAETISKYIQIQRLLGHGLDFVRAAKLLNEGEPELRKFYGEFGQRPEAKEQVVKTERARQIAADVLPLVGPSVGPFGPVLELRLVARDVAAALAKHGGLKDAARKALNVSPDDLQKWVEENSAILEALK